MRKKTAILVLLFYIVTVLAKSPDNVAPKVAAPLDESCSESVEVKGNSSADINRLHVISTVAKGSKALRER